MSAAETHVGEGGGGEGGGHQGGVVDVGARAGGVHLRAELGAGRVRVAERHVPLAARRRARRRVRAGTRGHHGGERQDERAGRGPRTGARGAAGIFQSSLHDRSSSTGRRSRRARSPAARGHSVRSVGHPGAKTVRRTVSARQWAGGEKATRRDAGGPDSTLTPPSAP
ncbi:predicted protein [Streptomyces sp. SPB78]|nr:predicted protein [Streptomyces sp. SPB78]